MRINEVNTETENNLFLILRLKPTSAIRFLSRSHFLSKKVRKPSPKNWKTSFEKNCFSAWESTLNMGLIIKG